MWKPKFVLEEVAWDMKNYSFYPVQSGSSKLEQRIKLGYNIWIQIF